MALVPDIETFVPEMEALRHDLHTHPELGFKEARTSALIAERLPATLELSLVAATLALMLSIPAGVYTALRPRSLMSRLLMSTSLIGVSLPTFLIGILLILFFGVILQWLPPFGRGEGVHLGSRCTSDYAASIEPRLAPPKIIQKYEYDVWFVLS